MHTLDKWMKAKTKRKKSIINETVQLIHTHKNALEMYKKKIEI